MSTNFHTFCFDEAEATKRSYKDLTDDDIAYIEAAVRLDHETTSGLLDKYFRQKMPNTMCKHRVWRRDNKADIWVYQIHRKNKSDAGWMGEGVYFYGAEEEAWKAVQYGWWLQGFYINVEHPLPMDRDLHDALAHANDKKVSERMTRWLEKNKFDGAFWPGDMREEWCVLDPRQLKRAEVTRDNQGRIIPISLRFDLENPDNRF